jgi:hypothetical protein
MVVCKIARNSINAILVDWPLKMLLLTDPHVDAQGITMLAG